MDLTDAFQTWAQRQADEPGAPAATLDPASLPFPAMTDRSIAAASPAGVIIEGAAALPVVWRATQLSADGYRPRLYLVQPDTLQLLDALATPIPDEILADERVAWCVGPDAPDQFARTLESHLDASLPSHIVRAPGTPTTHRIEQIVRATRAAQEREHVFLQTRVGDHDAGRDASHSSDRFAAHTRAPDTPRTLRVLIPVSRYSTFVRHAARDLAEGFRGASCEALILEEPSSYEKLSSIAYLRAFDTFQPDLLVLINHARAQIAHVTPRGVPTICWIQDRMQHLFDERIGNAMTPLDHVWGHLHPSLFTAFAYPRDRAHWGMVPASAAKFHSAPDADDFAARAHTCDIAYAGHQSETPDAFHVRMRHDLGAQGPLGNALDIIRAELNRLCSTDEETDVRAALDTLTEQVLRAVGMTAPDPRVIAVLDGSYTRPLAEKLWRHQTLEWAAAIAKKHNLRFHIHGNGWDAHPTLHPYARPALDHAESLRAAYRHARVHLHASLATNAHQRVFECALSGGLMLRRGPSPDASLIKKCAQKLIHERFEPAATRAHRTGTCLEYNLALPAVTDTASPEAWRTPDVDRLRRMKGKPAPEARPDGLYPARFRIMDADIDRDFALIPEIPLWTFPDYAFPRADETLFRSPAQLEARILRGVRDDAWRESTARAHRTVALQWHTYERTAREMIEFVGARLSGQVARDRSGAQLTGAAG